MSSLFVHRWRFRIAAAAAPAAGSLILATSSGAYAVKTVAADVQRAQAILIRPAEVPTDFHRVGHGTTQERLLSCAGYNPKTSDIVSTGYANATYSADNVERIYSMARVLKTPKMVRVDERRSFTASLVDCLYTKARAFFPASVSVRHPVRLAAPRSARFVLAYRIGLVNRTNPARPVAAVNDVIFIDGVRVETETSLVAVFGDQGTTSAAAVEDRLARYEVWLATRLGARAARR